jgi:hypothetical protein
MPERRVQMHRVMAAYINASTTIASSGKGQREFFLLHNLGLIMLLCEKLEEKKRSACYRPFNSGRYGTKAPFPKKPARDAAEFGSANATAQFFLQGFPCAVVTRWFLSKLME